MYKTEKIIATHVASSAPAPAEKTESVWCVRVHWHHHCAGFYLVFKPFHYTHRTIMNIFNDPISLFYYYSGLVQTFCLCCVVLYCRAAPCYCRKCGITSAIFVNVTRLIFFSLP